MRDLILVAAGAVIGFAGIFLLATPDHGAAWLSASLAGISRVCSIKGNVSIGSGERIYHLPGQEYYAQTIIRPEYGERWFCSEAEARSAGWRRSRT
jgi:hypothetical protein